MTNFEAQANINEPVKTSENETRVSENTNEAIKNLEGRAKTEVPEKEQVVLLAQAEMILSFDKSEHFSEQLKQVNDSKKSWIESRGLADRLVRAGADDDGVKQVQDWLQDNLKNTKIYVLSFEKMNEIKNIFSKLTGDNQVMEGKAFHAPGGNDSLPPHFSNAIYIATFNAPPPLSIPGKPNLQNEVPKEIIDINTLHHEMGHAVEDGLLESELFSPAWAPKFKQGAVDTNYFGNIKETDTRVRAMFRILGTLYDSNSDTFTLEHVQKAKKIQLDGKGCNDLRELLNTYDDDELVKIANYLPAI